MSKVTELKDKFVGDLHGKHKAPGFEKAAQLSAFRKQ